MTTLKTSSKRPVTVDSRRGSTLAQACITFGPMNPHEPIFVAPPITEIPDYVWLPRYDRPSWIPGRPVKKPKDTSQQAQRVAGSASG